jgi:hypothetical protein
MPARLTAFVPDSAAIARSLEPGERLRIGRADDCALVLAHASISRAHAELRDAGGYWQLSDLGSKNGSFVDGAPVDSARLDGSCWLRFGDVHCEFALLDSNAQDADALRWHERQRAATAYTVQLDTLAGADPAQGRPFRPLLEASLRAMVELAGCERGFLLIDEGGSYRVGASLALDPAQMAGAQFAGSLGAVSRAIEQRRPVVFNDLGQDAWLDARESVVRGGLRTLACLPLLDGDRVLGAIYVDRRSAGPPLTTLDLQLLEAFTERTALWLSAHSARDALTAPAPPGGRDWGRILADLGDPCR